MSRFTCMDSIAIRVDHPWIHCKNRRSMVATLPAPVLHPMANSSMTTSSFKMVKLIRMSVTCANKIGKGISNTRMWARNSSYGNHNCTTTETLTAHGPHSRSRSRPSSLRTHLTCPWATRSRRWSSLAAVWALLTCLSYKERVCNSSLSRRPRRWWVL